MSERDLDKLDRIAEHLADIRTELVAIKIDLNHHMVRSDMLEKHVKLLETDIVKMRGFFAYIGYILGVGATIITILSQLKVF